MLSLLHSRVFLADVIRGKKVTTAIERVVFFVFLELS